MKKYEIVYIIHPDLEGSTAKITEKVKASLEKAGGKVLNEESWGKKKLAYAIGKNAFGIYEFLLVEMEPASVKEIERTLRLSEEVIRSLVSHAEEKVESKREPKNAVKKTETKPKEEAVKEEKETVKKEVKETKKTKAEKEKEQKERQKELDEKLQAIIGPDTES